MSMERITVLGRFSGSAQEPSGEPPQTEPRGTSTSLEGGPFAAASYRNHVTYTSQATFSETGTIVFDDGAAELDIASASDGVIEPAAEEPLLRGSVVYRIVAGRGRLEGASGLITSNFVLDPASGRYEEGQVAILHVPER
jgi:hypothetical protein